MRVVVIGSSGAGKTTFGRALAARLGAPFIELDAIAHQAEWRRLPPDDFRARVTAATAPEAWVCDGKYAEVDTIVRARATDVVWLDPPKWVALGQVIQRSVSRAITGRELYNGNRERVSAWADPGHPIRWVWRNFDRARVSCRAYATSAAAEGARVHRAGDRRASRALLATLGSTGN